MQPLNIASNMLHVLTCSWYIWMLAFKNWAYTLGLGRALSPLASLLMDLLNAHTHQ